MYSTCLFCHSRLGANDVLEAFPIGRRLAFDAAKGRLWVVCRRCTRWNLSPLEERWEAVEECERLFRGARLKVSTQNVGLARLLEGTELVQVGRPERAELAAWRYGEQLMRRHRRSMAQAVAGAAVSVPLLWTGAYSALAAALPGGALLLQAPTLVQLYRAKRSIVARSETATGDRIVVRRKHLATARLRSRAQTESGWRLEISHDGGEATLEGENATWLAGKVLARLNQVGGRQRLIQRAVARLEQEGGGEALFAGIAARPSEEQSAVAQWWHGGLSALPGTLQSLAIPDRLALEMASNEESERLAMAGELRMLELAWREAEEIASIADALTLPKAVEESLERHRSKTLSREA
jgi:hypothetical protein